MNQYPYTVDIDANGRVTLTTASGSVPLQNGNLIQLPFDNEEYRLTFTAPTDAVWRSASFWAPHLASATQGTNFVTATTDGVQSSTETTIFEMIGVKLKLVSLNSTTLVIKNLNQNQDPNNNSVFIAMRFVFRRNNLVFTSGDPQIEDLKGSG